MGRLKAFVQHLKLPGLILLFATRLHAQSGTPGGGAAVLLGTVADSAGPLTGVFVEALDQRDQRIAGRLTDPEGHFRLELFRDGKVRVRAQQVGYADTTAAVQVEPGKSVFVHILMRAQPILLPAVHADSKHRCNGVTAETAQLWSELSKALRVADWAEAAAIVDRDYVLWTRTFRASDQLVTSYQPRETLHRQRAPFRSISSRDLERYGYVRTVADTTIYFAPDAATLLSASFLGTHCFGVTRDVAGDRAALIGLTFRPQTRVSLPDVEGTLWLTPDSLRLSYLEYDYVNVPNTADIEPGSGRVEFQHLPDGAWLVSRWWIRIPMYTSTPGVATLGNQAHYQLDSFHEDGGEVRALRSVDAAPAGWGKSGAIAGVVYDSLRRRPVSGAVVSADGTPFKSATTDSTGRFRIDGIPAGAYALKAAGGVLDSIAPELRPAIGVSVRGGEEGRADLSLASYSRLREHVCHAADHDRNGALLSGFIGAASDQVPRTVDVSAKLWQTSGGQRDAKLQYTTFNVVAPVDANGWFRVCDVPADVDVVITSPAGAHSTVRAKRGTLLFVAF